MDTSAALLPPGSKDIDTHPASYQVHRDYVEQAITLIREHFDLNEGLYSLKYNDIATRLKAFNFYEIPQELLASNTITEVEVSGNEISILIRFGERLLKEVSNIEMQQDRVVFYYDAIEPLIERLQANKAPQLSPADLLAMLEILQIYCDDPDFSAEANGIAEGLLDFFAGQAQ